MGKLKVNLVDKSFISCGPSCGTGQTGICPKNIEWINDEKYSYITVFTDFCFNEPLRNTKYNIAWIIESKLISPHLYTDLEKYNKYDFVLTHDKELLNFGEKFVFVPLGGHWIFEEDCKIYKKSKNISIIASSKKQTYGHLLRHEIIFKFKKFLDGIFGNNYFYLQNKIEGLRDFRFHVVIENAKYDYWFTEKLIDALITGCIPIYYGSPNIKNFFNEEGILCFDTIDDFEYILKNYVNESYYKLLLESGVILDNFNRAKQFLTPEDYMYEKLLKDL